MTLSPTLPREQRSGGLVLAAVAAFCTYFCMYAFRKPFSAGTFDGLELYGLGLKSVLVIAQGGGYMVSKFIGIKVISEMRPERRAIWLVGMIVFAELALVGFAVAPLWAKPLLLFLNGLPLGMVFGLVLGYLEGRRQTEALSAVLCSSFIISSGVVKSAGQWTIQSLGFSEYQMPMIVGLMFLPPFLVSVWLLQHTPPPTEDDIAVRQERKAMNGNERRDFLAAYWPGLSLLVLVYVLLTVIRTIRDDFGVEIWRDLGISKPAIFAQSETTVALFVAVLNGLVIWIHRHVTALRVTIGLMGISFALVAIVGLVQPLGTLSPFAFMIACGVGLYIPYVAFHTTVFERLIAASGRPCNLGFLMYLADAIGYLGYSLVLVFRESNRTVVEVLPFFRVLLVVLAGLSFVAMLLALAYFQRVLKPADVPATDEPVGEGTPAAMPVAN
ncbi:MAG: hypothetical protein KF777_08165 [Planctomycetaceae bacterium]|nr:hypothetical protein [Planctomycetaceae bacterium]